jgi:hypothetical protein
LHQQRVSLTADAYHSEALASFDVLADRRKDIDAVDAAAPDLDQVTG